MLQKKDINLVDVVSYLGENVIKSGSTRYKLERHDSLIMKDNVFYWNSRSIGGNYYVLLKSLYNYTPNQISKVMDNLIKDIENGNYVEHKMNKEIDKSFSLKNHKYKREEEDFEQIKNYLCDKRKLDEKAIYSLFKSGYINYNRNYNNICFMIKNGNEIVGEEVVGTRKRFKCNTTIDDGFYLKNITNDGYKQPSKLYVFESAIDMISYIELNRTRDKETNPFKNSEFISLSGVREDIFVKHLHEELDEIHVCTDNDQAGEKFYNFVKEKYSDYKFIRHLPKNKDFNEDLIKSYEKNKEKGFER